MERGNLILLQTWSLVQELKCSTLICVVNVVLIQDIRATSTKPLNQSDKLQKAFLVNACYEVELSMNQTIQI